MKELICFIFGHKYRLKRKITYNVREVKCLRCKKEWAMNDYTATILPLDDELKSMHDEFINL